MTSNNPSCREKLSLDNGWRFHIGDIPFPRLISHSECYSAAKAARATGAASPGYDDTGWPVVNVPHDWASESPFEPGECLSQGYRRRGIGWYRRHFRLDSGDRGRHLEIQFDGVATHCTVWLNGNIVHRNWCGYTGWNIDLTPYANYGEEPNTIAVRVDADAMEGWWYEGAGIYRHTWLVKRDPTHIITDGVWANPVRDPSGNWSVPIELTAANIAPEAQTVELVAHLIAPSGEIIGSAGSSAKIDSLATTTARLRIAVDSPRLWSCDQPVLYMVRNEVRRNGAVVDSVQTTCGFRTVCFDADEGFFLNEKPLKIKGVCNHQDHAGVGVAIPDALWEWRLRQLQNIGVNACRVAHNPPSNEFLELCDRLGILVMDENRHFNCSPEYVRQLEWLIRRDRNHPCVILWSVFNEEPMQGSETGYEMVRRMSAIVRSLDPTRPVTAAMNGGLFAPVNVSQAVDVAGFNYQIESYDRFHAANRRLPLTSSEDTSAFMTRGAYHTVVEQNIRDAYDTQFAPWGASHRDAWRAIATRPYLAGGFVWTGFDYHGEPTPHQWPSASSFFGIFDLCGFPKTAAFIHKAHWLDGQPVLEIIPHWTWPGREGKSVRVLVISNGARVSLWLNGACIGEKNVDLYDFATWEGVTYEPGRIEAVAYDAQGKEVARIFAETTGEPEVLELIPDRRALSGDGADAQPITVRALDRQGRPVPTANLPVRFAIRGPGAIIGLGNGDPNCHEPEKGDRRSLFNGLAQILVQSMKDSCGEIVVQATADGLRPAEIRIPVVKAPPIPAIAAAEPIQFLQAWNRSPLSNERIDPNIEVADNDMNTWPCVQPGELQTFTTGNFALYRTKFLPFQSVQQNGGRIHFEAITGKTEVWIDGTMPAKRDTPGAGPITVAIPPAIGTRRLTVLIETESRTPAGLSGPVFIST
jgi:beta-galactosidase